MCSSKNRFRFTQLQPAAKIDVAFAEGRTLHYSLMAEISAG
jgi:hypothetical protein